MGDVWLLEASFDTLSVQFLCKKAIAISVFSRDSQKQRVYRCYWISFVQWHNTWWLSCQGNERPRRKRRHWDVFWQQTDWNDNGSYNNNWRKSYLLDFPTVGIQNEHFLNEEFRKLPGREHIGFPIAVSCLVSGNSVPSWLTQKHCGPWHWVSWKAPVLLHLGSNRPGIGCRK